MEKARGRRRRVPAFGEWNYYYHSGELSTPAPAAAEWYAPAQGTEASSDVWFRYSPPPRKPPPPPNRRKAIRRPESSGGGKRRAQAATPARASDAGASKPARTPVKTATARRVVRSVDADLYQVPPPDFEHDEPRRTRNKKASRSTWMACFGFSCCVA
ncbi:hypothetical protein PR202_ga31160 [Eleusine coracana subsp. coracana]|uniref:Uncharacterized protein n=1 Tax=Eleusine coracana subsp. coracana TaxID=191504 RepID=A0AAV5DRR6_ELECO|nr:hypothetical protein QOZ80_5AG0388380 [Eleusine coracana subsp. coracana]GJN12846.1 hypothetical protein PR202_ga31160 [Eleusine coracana subsp. coracana]